MRADVFPGQSDEPLLRTRSGFRQSVVVLGCGTRDAVLDQEFNLVTGESRPIRLCNELHGAVQKANLAQHGPPRAVEMVAARSGISVKQNRDLGVVRFAQALDIDAAALFLGDVRAGGQSGPEDTAIIAATCDIMTTVWRIAQGPALDQQQQSVAKTVGVKRKFSVVIFRVQSKSGSCYFDAVLMHGIDEPKICNECHQRHHQCRKYPQTSLNPTFHN